MRGSQSAYSMPYGLTRDIGSRSDEARKKPLDLSMILVVRVQKKKKKMPQAICPANHPMSQLIRITRIDYFFLVSDSSSR